MDRVWVCVCRVKSNMSLWWSIRSMYLPAMWQRRNVSEAWWRHSLAACWLKDRIMRGWVNTSIRNELGDSGGQTNRASEGITSTTANSHYCNAAQSWSRTTNQIFFSQAWIWFLNCFTCKFLPVVQCWGWPPLWSNNSWDSDPFSFYNPGLSAHLVIRWLVPYNTKPNKLWLSNMSSKSRLTLTKPEPLFYIVGKDFKM